MILTQHRSPPHNMQRVAHMYGSGPPSHAPAVTASQHSLPPEVDRPERPIMQNPRTIDSARMVSYNDIMQEDRLSDFRNVHELPTERRTILEPVNRATAWNDAMTKSATVTRTPEGVFRVAEIHYRRAAFGIAVSRHIDASERGNPDRGLAQPHTVDEETRPASRTSTSSNSQSRKRKASLAGIAASNNPRSRSQASTGSRGQSKRRKTSHAGRDTSNVADPPPINTDPDNREGTTLVAGEIENAPQTSDAAAPTLQTGTDSSAPRRRSTVVGRETMGTPPPPAFRGEEMFEDAALAGVQAGLNGALRMTRADRRRQKESVEEKKKASDMLSIHSSVAW